MAGESTPMLPERRKGSNVAVYISFVFPALAGLMYGYDIGAASPAVASFQLYTELTAFESSLLTSASLIGAVPGSMLIFWVGEPLGRRREILVASVLYMIGTTLSIATVGDAALGLVIFGRILYGFGIAFAMHAAPAYIAEMAPADLRGTLISLKEAFIVFGVLLAYIVAAITQGAMKDQSQAWRVIWCPPIAFSLVVGFGMYWLPPSPRWLVSRGEIEEATKALQRLRTDAELPFLRCLAFMREPPTVAGHAEIEAEVEDMVASLRHSRRTYSISRGLDEAAAEAEAVAPPSGFLDVIQDVKDLGAAPRALILGFGLVLLQQFTGQPNVLYYVQSIFVSAGFSLSQAAYIDIIVGSVKLVATLSIVPFVDRTGRVPLLNAGTSLMLVSVIVLCLGFSLNPTDPGTVSVTLQGAWSSVVIAAVIVYVIGYQVGFGPITWVMISECFPLQLRARALSVAATLNFGFNLLVTLINGPIAGVVGGQAVLFGFFAGMCVLALFFFHFFVPETKGKSLEEIDALMRRPFGDSSSAATDELDPKSKETQ